MQLLAVALHIRQNRNLISVDFVFSQRSLWTNWC